MAHLIKINTAERNSQYYGTPKEIPTIPKRKSIGFNQPTGHEINPTMFNISPSCPGIVRVTQIKAGSKTGNKMNHNAQHNVKPKKIQTTRKKQLTDLKNPTGHEINSTMYIKSTSPQAVTSPCKPKKVRKLAFKVGEWTTLGQNYVREFFRKEIENKCVPTKLKCMECIMKGRSLLRGRNWFSVQSFVALEITKAYQRKGGSELEQSATGNIHKTNEVLIKSEIKEECVVFS